ncbi:MAG: AraC family transcriptional regulator [bacterium]|nr:AraC family transcriptional regulator [bacterium]
MNLPDYITLFTVGLVLLMALGQLIRPIRFRTLVFAILLIFLGYLHLFLFLVHSLKILEYPHFIFIHAPVIVGIGPLIYFYILSLGGNKETLSRKEWFHFAPAIILLTAEIPLILLSAVEKREFIELVLIQKKFILPRLGMVAAVSMVVIYVILSLRTIVINLKSENRSQKKLAFWVLLLMAWLFTGMTGIIAVITLSFSLMKIISILISVIIICLYLLDQRYPHLIRFATVPLKRSPQAKSNLDKIDLDNTNKQLTMLMEEEKFYCDEDLSLARLSEALELTPHQLSRFLNEHHKKNFNIFINEYRVADAQDLLLTEPTRNTLSIAYAVGFNSYSTFHSVFKKNTGLSPAEFRRNHLEK